VEWGQHSRGAGGGARRLAGEVRVMAGSREEREETEISCWFERSTRTRIKEQSKRCG
jgi:hypothetical protein